MIVAIIGGCFGGQRLNFIGTAPENLGHQIVEYNLILVFIPLLFYALYFFCKSSSKKVGLSPIRSTAGNDFLWSKDVLHLERSSLLESEDEKSLPFSNFDSSMVWKCMLVFLSLFLVARGLGLLG